MTKLYISEYAKMAPGGSHPQMADETSWIADQVVDYSGGATASNALNKNTRLVRLHNDSICSVVSGTAPVATTANRRMAANMTEYFGIPEGGAGLLKFSAITNT